MIIVLAILLIAIVVFVFGHRRRHRTHTAPEEKAVWTLNRIARRLNLSQDQRLKLAAIKNDK
jgi:capsule polysaccharide modification protein KpsS